MLFLLLELMGPAVTSVRSFVRLGDTRLCDKDVVGTRCSAFGPLSANRSNAKPPKQSGIPTCIHRMRHFAPYADLMWAETAVPKVKPQTLKPKSPTPA